MMKTYSLPRYGLKQIIGKDAIKIADEISLYVQECGGGFSIHRHCINFYVPSKYALFVKIMYPFLEETV
jgi:hypothetical protein